MDCESCLLGLGPQSNRLNNFFPGVFLEGVLKGLEFLVELLRRVASPKKPSLAMVEDEKCTTRAGSVVNDAWEMANAQVDETVIVVPQGVLANPNFL